MLKSKTHFEQVPLEALRKIVQEQIRRKTAMAEEIEKETLVDGFAGAQEPSMAELANFLTESYRNNS
jgi:hypothetical protein